MYRHLLVPVDGSELSVITTKRALELASQLGARVTFLYARPDYGATQDGALAHVITPEHFSENSLGETNVFLSKASAAAIALNVEHSAVSVADDHPHRAIVKAATDLHCDLIFMASHGSRGLRRFFRSGETEKVLQNSTIPVLVASVESNDPLSMMHRASAIIHDEHCSLAVVIRGLLEHATAVRSGLSVLDEELIAAMLRYLKEFPSSLHHPKEENYIFAKLRAKSRNYDAVLDELELQHHREAILVQEMDDAFVDFQEGGRQNFAPLDEALSRLASAIWAHMKLEEESILPAAKRLLTISDWQEIFDAFSQSKTPLVSDQTHGDYQAEFKKIAGIIAHDPNIAL